jgi:hypothetical protein
MMKAISIFMLLPMLSCLSACTTERGYGAAQAWQRNQCNRLPDKAEVDRCVGKADTSYEAYTKQREVEPK